MPCEDESNFYRAYDDAEADDCPACASGKNVPPGQEETAEYLAAILPELAGLADRAGMELTSYLLRVAHRDVRDTFTDDR